MYIANKVDYGKYLNPISDTKKSKKQTLKLVWSWTKVFLFLFMIITMLWGCIQNFQPKYSIMAVSDMSGRNFFNAGVNLEIILKSLGDNEAHKTYWFFKDGNSLKCYKYIPITSWADSFKVTKSPYYGLFVYPMTWFLSFNIKWLNGWSLNTDKKLYPVAVIFGIFFTCFFVKLFIFSLSWKQQLNQDKMMKFQTEQQKIKSKYKGDPSKEAKQKMQIEMLKYQKKENLNPYAQIVVQFMMMPVLYSLYTGVRTSRTLRITTVGQVSLTGIPWSKTISGEPIYFTFIALYVPIQFFASILPILIQVIEGRKKHETNDVKKQRRKNIIMSSVLALVFAFMVANIPTGVVIYWTFSSSIQIFQVLSIHFLNKTKPKRQLKKREKLKLIQAKKILKIRDSESPN
ncbi:membrane protein insertase YidC [Spiroplasma endosymbiont of Aspidapion aeneum]|uniref:membrane protein insertase YidC n=1 Tax=Spiroplasma endosymbiont of Aspidapion aeneum TaxID=3066276 RepID=UPI00313B2AA8